MEVRYSGEFVSRGGRVWHCDILQESDSAFQETGDLDFPSDEALVIEWDEKSLDSVICPSKATLTILSPGDRTYADLYTVRPTQIRLDVYYYLGNNQKRLYWSGCLDPEFYEEPYDRGEGYEVSLTFSDFGILKRIPYDLSGRQTLRDILEAAIVKSNIRYYDTDESYISTMLPGGETPIGLDELKIASENFIDEEGEASDYYTVVESILQPLACRLVQRRGYIWVYDINGLRKGAPNRRIAWNGVGSVMGVDSVYNDICITFSPYGKAELMSGDLEYRSRANDGDYTFFTDYGESHTGGQSSFDPNLISFKMALSYADEPYGNVSEKGAGNRFFKMTPVLGGQEGAGIAGGFYSGPHSLDSWRPQLVGIDPADHTNGSLAFSMQRIYVPFLPSTSAAKYLLRIRQELLSDPRYNPFEEASDDNEGDNYKVFQKRANMAFIPVAVTVFDDEGTALCHWKNSEYVQKGHPDDSVKNTLGIWESGAASFGDAWLAYYNPEDLSDTGLGGWAANRQCFGKPWVYVSVLGGRKWKYEDAEGSERDFYLFDSMKKIPDGQFVPYPPQGGYLEIKVYNGVWIFRDRERFTTNADEGDYHENYSKLRWQMYKLPEVSLVSAFLPYDKVESDDIEYSGVANLDAKDALEIDTICGTTPESRPSARGTYIVGSTGEPLRTLVREGREDCPEHLLIGTLYSQFASRRTTLTGDAEMDAGTIATYYDDAQENGTVFLIRGESQNVIEDTSRATFVEIRPDEYDGE